jgi:hypothetical protein
VNRRALPALIVLLVGFAALIAVGREEPTVADPYFTTPAGAWMPAVSDNPALTGSWFCPGVPATGEDGVGGDVVVANRDDEQLIGRFTILTPDGVGASDSLVVEPWSRTTIDVDAFVTAPYASVVVEIDGGRGIVEQRAFSTRPATRWRRAREPPPTSGTSPTASPSTEASRHSC